MTDESGDFTPTPATPPGGEPEPRAVGSRSFGESLGGSVRQRIPSSVLRALPKPDELPAPAPASTGLRLRSKLVIAMVLAALVPVAVVAAIATGVILSNLEQDLREDSARQLTVGLNLILRSIERFGDEAVQLSESRDVLPAVGAGSGDDARRGSPDGRDPLAAGSAAEGRRGSLDTWLAHAVPHMPSARVQVLDANGALIFDRMVVGALTCDPAAVSDANRPECTAAARFAGIGLVLPEPGAGSAADASAAATAAGFGWPWTRGVTPVALGDRAVVRATSPIVDTGLALRGMVVLSMPLDGDFADSIKGALSADVLIGGVDGRLATTFRSGIGRRADDIELDARDLAAALHGQRIVRNLDTGDGRFTVAVTGLFDRDGKPVGIVGVAVDRAPLTATKALAIRSLVIGGLAALAFALVLAAFWSRRLGAPIGRLHRGAIAVSRGDLDHRIEIAGGDELTDLAAAFNQMTSTLKDNQARLAARMREIVALHDAGRAVSSVIDLDQVSRKIVDAVARTFDVQLAALWLAEPGGMLRTSAARARRPGVASVLTTQESLAAAEGLRLIATRVQTEREPVRLAHAADDAEAAASVLGPIVALPLDRKNRVVGVLAVARDEGAREFSDADLNLLTTFADQAAAAVENAQLYDEVRNASEELDRKVRLRTAELTAINSELGRALADLRETQAQLVLSERMAGLGLLVAGVAHEINSPSAAIRGSIDSLEAAVARVAAHGAELAQRARSPRVIDAFIEELAPQLAERPLATGLAARKAARELQGALEAAGLDGSSVRVHDVAGALADLGATPADATRFVGALGDDRKLAPDVVAALTDHVYLHRTASTVRHAVAQIQRIVGALKSYSHLDQQAVRTDADLHDGLETTLTLLHHALRDIVIERRYGVVPPVPIFVDELNQVWTNLISNAQHALASGDAAARAEPPTIAIETAATPHTAVVRVIDNGPGVPADALPRIFEPFFTTKPKGEGTGLGLGIARQIVAKHGGELRCESRPGYTCFEVRLPIVVSEAESESSGTIETSDT